MEVTLFLLLSHQSFDWFCRTSPSALVSTLEVIVKDLWNLKQVETAPSSPLFKAATKKEELKMFVKVEEDNLKNYVVKVEEKEEKDEEEK